MVHDKASRLSMLGARFVNTFIVTLLHMPTSSPLSLLNTPVFKEYESKAHVDLYLVAPRVLYLWCLVTVKLALIFKPM